MANDRQTYDWEEVPADEVIEMRFFADRHSAWVEQANKLMRRIGRESRKQPAVVA
jgi:hypothetical protein